MHWSHLHNVLEKYGRVSPQWRNYGKDQDLNEKRRQVSFKQSLVSIYWRVSFTLPPASENIFSVRLACTQDPLGLVSCVHDGAVYLCSIWLS